MISRFYEILLNELMQKSVPYGRVRTKLHRLGIFRIDQDLIVIYTIVLQ